MSVNTRKGILWLGAGVGAVVLAGLMAGLPAADSPTRSSAPQNAMRVQFDPDSGEIIPLGNDADGEVAERTAKRLDRSVEGLTEVRQADGGVALNLEGRFQSLAVATIDSNGQVTTGCVTNERELNEFMHGAGATRDEE